jgi:hypothetical protein
VEIPGIHGYLVKVLKKESSATNKPLKKKEKKKEDHDIFTIL